VLRVAGKTAGVPAQHVLEVVTPRTNAERLTSAEHLFSSLVTRGAATCDPVSLELVGDSEQRRFLARTSGDRALRRVRGQLGAGYPQAVLRPFDAATFPTGDPVRVGPDEQIEAATLQLHRGEHLPLRTFDDRELDPAGQAAQVDPLLSVLGALANLPRGWRAVVQVIVLAPAPRDWARAHQHLALERPLETERRADRAPSLVGPAALLALLGLGATIAAVADAWMRGDWLSALGLAIAVACAAVVCISIVRWLTRREPIDPRLVQAKLSRQACAIELRLAIIAPSFIDSSAVRAQLAYLATAYQPFALATGNSLVACSIRSAGPDLRVLEPHGRQMLLNVRELAGLWHLPQACDDVALVEHTTARRRLPLPATVAADARGDSCRIGVSTHQAHAVPVHLPTALLGRHLLAVAKTRRGKSSLLLCLVHHLMRASERRALVLVDPHRDLALSALGLVPRTREVDVVYLDVSNRRRPFGINLFDTGLGWNRDQATANALRIFRREFDGYWGPRMEDAFRFAILALFEANQALCAEDPRGGRSAQHTILDVPAILERPAFRRQVLKRTSDPFIRDWFDAYFQSLDERFRQEIINPVRTKVNKYLGSHAARQLVGQPRSTIDFRALVAEAKVVIVNLNAFDVGEDVAALVGGTLLNLAARAISAQSVLAPEARKPVTIVVDEFHTIPGADYEQVLGELAKYGANLLLASQTLSRLDRLTDAQRTRDLRAAVFSNLDGLFAFHTSAEDAAYLAEELGGGLDAQDLLELGHYQCYARVTDVRSGERLPAFSVRLDPPPPDDQQRAIRLARASAEVYGRDTLDVELDLQAALERVRGPRRAADEELDEPTRPPVPTAPNTGAPGAAAIAAGAEVPGA
jgi:hypothetical protein